MYKYQKALIITPIAIVILMIPIVLFLTGTFGTTIGYIALNLVYWLVFCIPCIAYVVKKSGFNIQQFYTTNNLNNKKRNLIYNLLAFLPVIATGFIVFIPIIGVAPLMTFFIAALYALINGSIEELFWRGLYSQFFDKIGWAYIFPTILFSLWHIAIALAKGMIWHGGILTLVMGAAFMGVLWGFIAFKTKNIRYTTIAHILTNFFAFSGMIYDNWFV